MKIMRHASRHDSRTDQFKRRAPLDVVERVRGKIVTVELPGTAASPATVVSFTLGQFAKTSLRTRDGATADIRWHTIEGALGRLYDSVRSGPATLTQKQVVALSGEVYGYLIAHHEDEPGTPQEWAAWKSFTRAALEGRIDGVAPIELGGRSDEEGAATLIFGDDLTAGVDARPRTHETVALEQRCGRLAFWVLGRHGLEIDGPTRLTLLREIAKAALQAGWRLKGMADGDYSPDPKAARFPPFQEKTGATISDAFERWKAEAKPSITVAFPMMF